MCISDWSSDVCSSDLVPEHDRHVAPRFPVRDRLDVEQRIALAEAAAVPFGNGGGAGIVGGDHLGQQAAGAVMAAQIFQVALAIFQIVGRNAELVGAEWLAALASDVARRAGPHLHQALGAGGADDGRSEEHTSELQSLMRLS